MQTGIEIGNYSSGLYGLPHMGEVIADYRCRKGWKSQEAFAIVCGVDRQTVAYWERKEYLADMDRRIFIAKMLKVPPALLGLTWLSMADQDKTAIYAQTFHQMARLSDESIFTLYEDILSFAYTSTDKYYVSVLQTPTRVEKISTGSAGN
jgi:DNA-binding XRE family transcriptional regulator